MYLGVIRQKLLFYASLIKDHSMLSINNLLIRFFNDSKIITCSAGRSKSRLLFIIISLFIINKIIMYLWTSWLVKLTVNSTCDGWPRLWSAAGRRVHSSGMWWRWRVSDNLLLSLASPSSRVVLIIAQMPPGTNFRFMNDGKKAHVCAWKTWVPPSMPREWSLSAQVSSCKPTFKAFSYRTINFVLWWCQGLNLKLKHSAATNIKRV
jgi:hypothetical protein